MITPEDILKPGAILDNNIDMDRLNEIKAAVIEAQNEILEQEKTEIDWNQTITI